MKAGPGPERRTAAPSSENGNVPLEPEHLTDDGNSRRLVRDHGQDLRFVHAWSDWLVWDTTRWCPDDTGEVLRRAKETVRGMYAEAGYTEDAGYRKELTRHAIRSEAERALRAMVNLAASEPGIPVKPDQLDADPWALNVLNGTLDLRNGELRPHRREDLITKLVPVPYDAGAACLTWLAFLERVLGGKADLIAFVQKFMGYALTGDTREQVIVIAWGAGANGKSTLVGAAKNLLADYAQHVSIDTLLARNGEAESRHELARLQGARLVAAVEGESGKRLAESLVKQLTGGDTVTARALYRDAVEFTPKFKLILATNHRPVIRGTDLAIWRRVRLVPFTVTIPPEEQDRELPAKLRAELPGILAWAVAGCRRWQVEGLGLPEEIRHATAAYRQDMDLIGGFIDDRCIEASDAQATVSGLYSAYLDWCQQQEEKPLSKKTFGRALGERGVQPVRTNTWRGWQGIRLRGQDDAPAWVTNDRS